MTRAAKPPPKRPRGRAAKPPPKRPRGRPAKPLAELATEPGRAPGRQIHLRLDAALAAELEREAGERGLPLSTVCLLRLRGERQPRR